MLLGRTLLLCKTVRCLFIVERCSWQVMLHQHYPKQSLPKQSLATGSKDHSLLCVQM